MSKAQEYRDSQEKAVADIASALKGKAAGKRDEATAIVTNMVRRYSELAQTTPKMGAAPAHNAIAVALVMGDAKQLAATIAADRSAGFGDSPKSTSSNMAWVLHAIYKAENPWTPGSGNRIIGKEEFRAMKVRNGGHIPDGMSVKEAVAAGFLTDKGQPIVHDSATLPADIQAKDAELVAFGVPEDVALRSVRGQ